MEVKLDLEIFTYDMEGFPRSF